MRPVAIIGAHAVRRPSFSEQRLEEVIFETVAAALEDAGLQRSDLDSVVLGASDELDGRSISSMLTVAPAGGLLKDELRTTSGFHALILSAMRLQSGLFNVGIAVSWSKASEASVTTAQWSALDPFVEREIGLVDPVATALMAEAYLAHFQRDVADLDSRAAQKWDQAARSSATGSALPWQQAASRHDYVAYPLRQEHLSPIVDGAAAIVLASPQWCEKRHLRHTPVWLRGMAWATDSYALAERSLWSWPVLQQASRTALRRAGYQLQDLTRYEVDDYSLIHEVLAVEAIGLAEPGKGLDYLTTQPSPAVNVSGGGFRGYPLVCGGLCRLAEVFSQIADMAADQRVLIHEAHGIAAQGHAIVLLER